ncbi:MAG: hypothetical protein GY708_11510 [Actinomycetia bacterium]|nr:hypothetical protein [Actinomycetes bacterium]MCP4959362.1 hypothetical protein [Actinomycetes bacterium]
MNRRVRRQAEATGSLVGRGWLQPHWLERQADPDSPAYTVGGADPSNTTGRNWTILGAVATRGRGAVDPRGLVVTGGSYSIDWWVKGPDGWRFPSRTAAVRQSLLDETPVVETRMRIGNGDVVHRTYAISGGDGTAVIEIENATSEAVAIGVALRPYDLIGPGRIDEISYDTDTMGVAVDGEVALFMSREPGAIWGSNLALGDLAELLEHRTDADDPAPASGILPVECGSGLGQAVVVFPLVHSTSLKFTAPFRVSEPSVGETPKPSDVPAPVNVAKGWLSQSSAGAEFDLPAGPIADTFAAARRHLMLFKVGATFESEPIGRPGVDWNDVAPILMAVDQMGWHRDAAEALVGLGDHQRRSGEIEGSGGKTEGTAAALAALGHHIRLSRVEAMAVDQADVVVGAVRFLDKRRRKGDRDELTVGLLPAREVAGHHEFRYADNFWALRALLDAVEILTLAGETEASSDVAAIAADLRVDLLNSFEAVIDRFGSDVLPATPHRSMDERGVDSLVAVWPTRVLRPEHPMMAATADEVRRRFMYGAAHHNSIGPRGLATHRTMRLAMFELLAGDDTCLERLRWMVEVASPTYTWPRTIHPRLGTGTSGDGHHGSATAHFVSLVRSLLVHSPPGDEPALTLFGVFPPEWLGQPIEVHKAPTEHGLLSFAIRWHGARPAILWELEPSTKRGVTLTIPGLDPTWSTNQIKGDALLGEPPDDLTDQVADPGQGFS